MSYRDDLGSQILWVENCVDELKGLNEFFPLFYDVLQNLYSRYLYEGVELKLGQVYLLLESHEALNRNVLIELEKKLRKLRELAAKIEITEGES